jgi:hypothetical protein
MKVQWQVSRHISDNAFDLGDRQAKVRIFRPMIDRTENRFGLKPGYLAADSAYGSADNLALLVKDKKIAPYIPMFDKSTGRTVPKSRDHQSVYSGIAS